MSDVSLSDTMTSSGPGKGGFGDILSQLPGALKSVRGLSGSSDTEKKLNVIAADDKSTSDQLAAMKAPDPTQLKLRDVPEAPKEVLQNPLKAFGDVATVLAMFGSLKTRAPLTSALNAAAAGMNAFQKGDHDRVEEERENWKEATDEALKQNQIELNKYQQIRDKFGDDQRTLQAHLAANAAAFDDQTKLAALRSGDVGTAIKLIETQENQQIKLQQIHDLQVYRDQQIKKDPTLSQKQASLLGQWYDAFSSQFGRLPTDQEVTERVAALKGSQPGGADSVNKERALSIDKAKQEFRDSHEGAEPNAQQLQDIIKKATQTGNARSPQTMAMQKFIDEHKDDNNGQGPSADELVKFAEDLRSKVKAASDFSTGPQGKQINSFNVAIAHLGTLDRMTDALENSNLRGFNSAAQKWAEETGDPAPTNFDVVKKIVGDEIVKAIVGSGGGVSDREAAQNDINRANSPAQLKGAANKYRELLAGQLKGLRKQYQTTTGKDDFEDRLLPETRKELETVSGDGSADLSVQAKKAWGAFDPDKYDYRMDPQSGAVQRKAKE